MMKGLLPITAPVSAASARPITVGGMLQRYAKNMLLLKKSRTEKFSLLKLMDRTLADSLIAAPVKKVLNASKAVTFKP